MTRRAPSGSVEGSDGAAPPAPVQTVRPEPVGRHDRAYVLGLIAVVLAVLALSCGSTIVKSADEPGPVVAFWRLAFGALIWHAFLVLSRRPLDRRAWLLALPGGLFFGLDLILFFSAVTLTRVANAEFIGALMPVLVVPIATIALGERVGWRSVVLGAIALSGVALILFNAPSDGTASNLKGDLLAVAAVGTWVSFFLVTKRARARVDTARFMAGMTTVAAVVVLPVAALADGGVFSMAPKAWVLCLVLAVLTGTAGHGMLVWAQGHVPVSTSSMLTLAQPGFAAVWAWIVLGESVRAIQGVGMAVVIGALALLSVIAART